METALDVLLLGSVPVVACVLFMLPVATRHALSLHHLHPTATSTYLSHFVHFRVSHLVSNLIGYTLAVTVGYSLAVLAEERRRFRVALCGLLFALPVALSAVNLAWPRPTLGYGSSGLVMGVSGLVPVFVFRYLQAATDATVTFANAPLLIFLGLAVTGLIAPLGWLGIGIATAAFLTGLLYACDLSDQWRSLQDLPTGHAELLAIAVVIVIGYPVIAFPANPSVRGGTLNLLTHLLGYILGFLPAYLTPGLGVSLHRVRWS